jgi:tripartite-type tricarboxylate transporter receptor subunit TctC
MEKSRVRGITQLTSRRAALHLAVGLTAAAAFGIAPRMAVAQDAFPSEPIEVVIHAGPGSGGDITARMVTVQAPAEFDTAFTVVNKPGGGGALALAYLAEQPADGHTLLVMNPSIVQTMIRSKTPTQIGDVVGVARATDDPFIVVVPADSPIHTVADLVKEGTARGLKYGISNVGSIDHVTTFRLTRAAGLPDPNVIPFSGSGDLVIAVASGNVDIATVNYPEAEAQIEAGKLRAVVTLTAERMKVLPDTPTATEAGLPVVSSVPRGFVVLKGTPEDRIARLEEGLLAAMSGPIYSTFLESTSQAPDSVLGRADWQAQLEQIDRDSREILTELGLVE